MSPMYTRPAVNRAKRPPRPTTMNQPWKSSDLRDMWRCIPTQVLPSTHQRQRQSAGQGALKKRAAYESERVHANTNRDDSFERSQCAPTAVIRRQPEEVDERVAAAGHAPAGVTCRREGRRKRLFASTLLRRRRRKPRAVSEGRGRAAELSVLDVGRRQHVLACRAVPDEGKSS